jgi:acyl dehydratase
VPGLEDVEKGQSLPSITQQATLVTSVMYAAASGDYNPLHYDAAVAADISPTGGVIAHGMFSMGLVSRVLTEFAGDPARVQEVDVRFTRPWPLGTSTTFGGTVREVTDDEVVVSLRATNEGGDTILRGTGRIRL